MNGEAVPVAWPVGTRTSGLAAQELIMNDFLTTIKKLTIKDLDAGHGGDHLE